MNNIISVPIEKELQDSYLSYAMSVIISRAIPDVRDGLKPVHRRILYAMYNSNFLWNKPYRKSARVVGEVVGKYHPHGDSSIYEALVRMTQDFSLRLPLVDGQGNFGSIDGDPPAAMRYTEARLLPVMEVVMRDLSENTVDFKPNYDGLEVEPEVLPAEFPNILVNGASGVAVGMATNIPTHNLGEVIDACFLYMDDEDAELVDLLNVIKGPDFPTGGAIIGDSGIHSSFDTGRGSIIIRGKTHVEKLLNGNQSLIIDEIPYQVNKSNLVENIANLVRDKKIEGISDLRDESDKNGIRVVIELKRNIESELIVNQLYRLTSLQVSFGINMMVLEGKKPKLMPIKYVLKSFISFRKLVVARRTEYRLKKARERASIVVAMSISLINIEQIIKIIRSAEDSKQALAKLLLQDWKVDSSIVRYIELISGVKIIADSYKLTSEQAKGILEMRLQKLTGLEREKLNLELEALLQKIKDCNDILSSNSLLMKIIRDELQFIKDNFATPRKTVIEQSEFSYDIEDVIPKEEMIVTVTASGYIKRVRLSHYRTQRRGGKGKSNHNNKYEDLVSNVFVANTHSNVLFFSNLGKVYRLKVYKIPLNEPQARGRALVNIFPMSDGEIINSVMLVPKEQEKLNIVFATSKGKVRRNSLQDFNYIPSNGKIAIKLHDEDKLIAVRVCKPEDTIMLSSHKGKSMRFLTENVRVFKGRTSDGVRGIRLVEDDYVISMSILSEIVMDPVERDKYLKMPIRERRKIKDGDMLKYADNEQFILTVTENGYGKCTSAYEYRVTTRGGIGILNIITSKRNGGVVASFPVTDDEEIMMITNKGQVIRFNASDVRITSRSTQGVILLRIKGEEKVTSVAKFVTPDSDTDIDLDNDAQEENQ